MFKSEDVNLRNVGRNSPASSSGFLGAIVYTKVDAGTGDSVLPFSGKRLVFGRG